MSRKERMQKRQGSTVTSSTVLQNNNDEANRLPDGIHGGETGSDVPFASQPKSQSCRMLMHSNTIVEEKKTGKMAAGAALQRRGTIQVPAHDEEKLR